MLPGAQQNTLQLLILAQFIYINEDYIELVSLNYGMFQVTLLQNVIKCNVKREQKKIVKTSLYPTKSTYETNLTSIILRKANYTR